jgi:alkylation response protein AidB-like acyl-CoA dehydrogenase
VDFDLSDQQKEIRSVAHDLLAERSSFAKVRAAAQERRYDEALWQELVELGWPGIAVAEEQGGGGLGMVELAVLLEELGYACAAVPFLGSALSAAALAREDAGAGATELLGALARGQLRAALGTRELVGDAAGAGCALLVDEDGALLVAEPRLEEVETIDPTRSYARIAGGQERPLGSSARGRILVGVAAELVGICRRALDMTLAYVKERKQFDVPVGSFQAVSHRCAEMFRFTESARSATYYAAWAADASEQLLAEAAALAAAAAFEAGREVTAGAIQMHGGIGFTWEADVHWLYKRAQLDCALLGSSKSHQVQLAKLAAERLSAVS